MRPMVFIAAVLGFGCALPALAESWLISADKVYTAPDAPALEQGVVLIVGPKIAAVAGQNARLAVPEGTRTADCRGVVVAGFQNSHVHFTEDAWRDAGHAAVKDLESRLEAMLTRYGFTTVFDTGSDLANTLALRERIEKGEVTGPRILTAGLPLYPVDGIPIYIRDLPAELLARLHQPKDPDAARAAVRGNLAAGANGTKLFLHTSPDGKNPAFMKLDVARAAVDETHARGALALAHPTSIEGIRGALAAGVDIIVHTTLGEREPWPADLLTEMTRHHMSVIPTLKLWPYELRKGDVPQPVMDTLVAATLAELRSFKAAGGNILFGTDVGYMHDYDPTEEYVFMSQAGLGAMDILASLTTAPAERWNEASRRGRVQAGMDADLVVLAGDPASDVRHFANVRCAFKAGKLIHASPGPQ